ncbi:hypothetical protein BDW67DRAFT_153234 [Aspergillus spinulosporus]
MTTAAFLSHSCAKISNSLNGKDARRNLTMQLNLRHLAQKVSDLDKYDGDLEKLEDIRALVDSGSMTKEEFVANALLISGSDTAPRDSQS